MLGALRIVNGQDCAVEQLCVRQVEVWFSQLTNRAIRRGSFSGVGELVTAIHNYIEAHNSDPKPFVRIASVEAILEKVNHCRAISRM